MMDEVLDTEVAKLNSKYDSEDQSDFWKERIKEHIRVIEEIHNDPDLLANIEVVGDCLIDVFKNGNKLLICGNGGSAADSQHIATEFVSKFYKERKAINAEAITVNTSIITAIGNDYDFRKVFARQIEANSRSGDALLVISTSGNAKNISEAINAGNRSGMKIVALTGANKNSLICKNAHYCLHVPSLDTPRIQEAHILIAHMLCEYVEKGLEINYGS